MKKIFLVCCLIIAVGSSVSAETKNEQTVIVVICSGLESFSITSKKEVVEEMVREYPDGLEVGNMTLELYCAQELEGFTHYVPGECKQ